MAGSCVWGVNREAIEQWGNTMCVLLVVLCGIGDCRGAYFFSENIFSGGRGYSTIGIACMSLIRYRTAASAVLVQSTLFFLHFHFNRHNPRINLENFISQTASQWLLMSVFASAGDVFHSMDHIYLPIMREAIRDSDVLPSESLQRLHLNHIISHRKLGNGVLILPRLG